MKLFFLPVLLLSLSAVPASALVNLGLSTQNFALKGIGNNSSGEGQSTVTFGTCNYDGTNTTCTISGPYNGFGSGGTYSFVIVYAGNGAFPLDAVSQSPGSNLFQYLAVGNLASFTITLTPTSGPAINFYSFANFSFTFSGATCTGVASTNCGVAAVGATPGATITGPITGSFDPTPSITPNGAITASNYGSFTSIAPGTWMEIYGVNLANVQSGNWAAGFVGNNAPTSVDGTSVTVAGIPAYVAYVSPGQIDIEVPSNVGPGQQQILVTTAGGTSTAYNITVNATEPGMLAPASFTIKGQQNVVAVLSNTTTYILPPGTISGLPTVRAQPGQYITLYGVGFGAVTPAMPAGTLVQAVNQINATVGVTIGGLPATVTYDGLGPYYTGLYQFNVIVPNIGASDATPVVFTVNGNPIPQNNLVIAVN